jgi:ubiquitin-like 1-activating enzyme E1 B
MADMWRARTPPVPLEYAGIEAGTFVLGGVRADAAPPGGGGAAPRGSAVTEAALKGTAAAAAAATGANGANSADAAKLKDQRLLSLRETLAQFVSSADALAARLRSGSEPAIAFDKDDPDALDFVTAGANLRAAAYGLPQKSRWEVKGAPPARGAVRRGKG